MRIMSSTGPVEIVTDSYRIGPIVAGQGQKNSPFKRLVINDKSGSANIGTVLVASADFVDQTILGNVSIIDGEKSRTLSGSTFVGNASLAALAATYSVIQLRNLSTSGKNVIVETINYSSSTAGFLAISLNAIVGATLSGNSNSKKSGGVVSICEVRTDHLAAIPNAGQIYTGSYGASVNAVQNPKKPIVVTPGYSINVYSGGLNTDLNAAFDFYEEAVM